MDIVPNPSAVFELVKDTRKALDLRRQLEDVAIATLEASQDTDDNERLMAAIEFLNLQDQAHDQGCRMAGRAKRKFFCTLTGMTPDELMRAAEENDGNLVLGLATDGLGSLLGLTAGGDVIEGDPDQIPTGLSEIPGIDLTRTADEPDPEADADGENKD